MRRLHPKRLHRDDSGQALAIGVFLLLLLALGMYMVATFGKHVREKQHVQTTADALALSLATLEAQSFNYVAFANRAQAAHYVTVMNMQAYASFFSSMEHTTLLTAMFLDLAYKACLIAEAVVGSCGVPSAFLKQTADRIFDAYKNVLRPAVDGIDVAFGSKVTQPIEALNKVLWVTEVIVTGIVAEHLITGGHEVFRQITTNSDPNWAITTPALIMNELFAVRNLNAYYDAFQAVGSKPFMGSGLKTSAYDNPATSPDVIRAQRIMTEVVNATRFDRSLPNRTIIGADKFGLAPVFAALRSVSKVPFIGKFTGKFGGETKLVGQIKGTDADTSGTWGTQSIETIFRSGANDSMLTTGQYMASADEWAWGRGSIWVKAGGGAFRHCRAAKVESLPVLIDLDTIKGGSRCVSNKADDGNHDYNGIAPYMLYNAGLANHGRPGEDFHQPDVYVWLHKRQDQVGFENAIKFDWRTKQGSASFDSTIARSAGLFGVAELQGVHAFARAQAYYHRPGNWEEPPNLFNPFWRSRLAPVVEANARPSEDLISMIGAFAGENVIFH